MKSISTNLVNVTAKLDPQTVKWVLLLISLGLLVVGAGAPLGGGSSVTGG